MPAVYIGIMLAIRVVQNICSKCTSICFPKKVKNIFRYYAYSKALSALGALVFLILEMQHAAVSVSPAAVLIAALSGAFLLIGSYCGTLSMQSGTMALTSMFSTAGVIIPCIAGIFMFGEPLSLLQTVGLVLFLIAAYLLTVSTKTKTGKLTAKQVLLLIISLIGNGMVMLMQKIYAAWLPGSSVSVYSFMTFFIPCVVMALLGSNLFFRHEKAEENATDTDTEKFPKKLLLFGALAAIAVLIINQLATICAGILPSVVLFLFINGGNTVIATLVGIFLFGEKINLRNAIGILLGIASLALIA